MRPSRSLECPLRIPRGSPEGPYGSLRVPGKSPEGPWSVPGRKTSLWLERGARSVTSLGRPWRSPGASLGGPWRVLGDPCGSLDAPWGSLVRPWRSLEGPLRVPWSSLGIPKGPWRVLEGPGPRNVAATATTATFPDESSFRCRPVTVTPTSCCGCNEEHGSNTLPDVA